MVQLATMNDNKWYNERQRMLQRLNFKNILSLTDWNDVSGKTITNESYDQFIKKFSLIYDDCFPIKVIEIKTKNLLSPWITKGIKKSSKRKQKLYENFLKKKSPNNEKE